MATTATLAARLRLRWRKLPLTRDQFMLLMAATNEIFLGIDIYLAHSISGTISPNEWIPIVFGPLAGAALMIAGLIALRRRQLATAIASAVLLASIVVGLLGAYFHFVRAILPNAPAFERVSVGLLVWGPPILGPLMFSLVGLLGLSAAFIEDPADSGRLRLWGERRLQLPYRKTNAYFYMVSLGSLATVMSSVLDHARTGFENPWLWLPTGVGLFATLIAAVMAAAERTGRVESMIYNLTMLTLMLVGAGGLILHIQTNLTAGGTIVGERFIRGAPFLAPLLFANMGMLGLISRLPASETRMQPSSAIDGSAQVAVSGDRSS
ncbi:MAG: hypothetical protein WBR18_07230 [Anaerolineales bacterium]